MIRAIAVDDEPVALDIISNHSERISNLKLEATFLSAVDAFHYVKSNVVDLIFMDISMPGLSGLEFAELVDNQLQVIFITAYPEHALKGFELAATDYLLKPINFNRFQKAVQLAESRKSSQNMGSDLVNSLFVKDGYKWISVSFDELIYIRGEDNYINLFLKDKSILTRMTLKEIQGKLSKNQFLRVHKSFIVSLSKIQKIERHQIIVSGTTIPLTLVTAESILKMLNW